MSICDQFVHHAHVDLTVLAALAEGDGTHAACMRGVARVAPIGPRREVPVKRVAANKTKQNKTKTSHPGLAGDAVRGTSWGESRRCGMLGVGMGEGGRTVG